MGRCPVSGSVPTKRSAMTPKDLQEVVLRIVVDPKDRPERIYINYAQVGLNPLDAMIEFCDLSPTPDAIKEVDGHPEVLVKARVRIVMTHDVFKTLFGAMKQVIEKHMLDDEERNEPKPIP